jgi:hypothetical protein
VTAIDSPAPTDGPVEYFAPGAISFPGDAARPPAEDPELANTVAAVVKIYGEAGDPVIGVLEQGAPDQFLPAFARIIHDQIANCRAVTPQLVLQALRAEQGIDASPARYEHVVRLTNGQFDHALTMRRVERAPTAWYLARTQEPPPPHGVPFHPRHDGPRGRRVVRLAVPLTQPIEVVADVVDLPSLYTAASQMLRRESRSAAQLMRRWAAHARRVQGRDWVKPETREQFPGVFAYAEAAGLFTVQIRGLVRMARRYRPQADDAYPAGLWVCWLWRAWIGLWRLFGKHRQPRWVRLHLIADTKMRARTTSRRPLRGGDRGERRRRAGSRTCLSQRVVRRLFVLFML